MRMRIGMMIMRRTTNNSVMMTMFMIMMPVALALALALTAAAVVTVLFTYLLILCGIAMFISIVAISAGMMIWLTENDYITFVFTMFWAWCPGSFHFC